MKIKFQTEQQKEKNKFKNSNNLRALRDNFKHININIIELPKIKREKERDENVFE